MESDKLITKSELAYYNGIQLDNAASYQPSECVIEGDLSYEEQPIVAPYTVNSIVARFTTNFLPFQPYEMQYRILVQGLTSPTNSGWSSWHDIYWPSAPTSGTTTWAYSESGGVFQYSLHRMPSDTSLQGGVEVRCTNYPEYNLEQVYGNITYHYYLNNVEVTHSRPPFSTSPLGIRLEFSLTK